MKKKKLIFCSIILLSIYIYFHRSVYITQYDWKHTNSEGRMEYDFIYFDEDSSWTYQWPIIKRNGKCNGLVLLCINERMIVFSLIDKKIGYYMSI